jgi:YYY domain-containing protein
LAGGTTLTSELQAVSAISWLCIITFLQLSLYPSLKKTFDTYAFPVSFGASLLLFTLISWYCGLVRIPIPLALLPFVVLFVYHLYRRHYTASDLKAQWRWELVFLLFFFLMLEVRFVNPTISYAEKFMDHAFLASVMRQPVVPPPDPWFSGGFLNVYYYLGYWMFGCLAIVSRVPSNIAFNLALPTVLAVSAVTLYATGDLLLDRFRWLPLGVLLVPNPSFFYQIIQGIPVTSALWDIGTGSTRTITSTINEYPLFSFTWGDLHPHVIGIFNQLFLIFVLAFALKRWGALSSPGRWVLCALAAVSLGSMPAINTWDVLIYAPVTLFFGILIWRKNRPAQPLSDAIRFLVVVPPLSLACYLPFYLQLRTTSGGVALVQAPSDPAQFILVHGFFIAIMLVLLSKEIVRHPFWLLVAVPFVLAGYPAAAIAVVPMACLLLKKERTIPDMLAILGLALITFCELVYLKDNMGDTYFRMNTVFKCYIAAWLLLGISAFTMAGQAVSRRGWVPAISKKQQAAAIVTVAALLFSIPLSVQLGPNYGSRSLDGLEYLATAHPGDAAAVAYLRALPGDLRIVEAEGGDYTYYSRISSFTGMPTIIGMPFHEFMWRGDTTGWYSERISDTRAVYEQPDRARPLMQKYNATFLIVGEPEKNRYSVNIPPSAFDLVFSQDGTKIYRIAG